MSIEKRLDRIERMLEDLQDKWNSEGHAARRRFTSLDDARLSGPMRPAVCQSIPTLIWSFNRDAKEKMRAAVEAGKFAEEEEQLHADKVKREMAEFSRYKK